VLAWFAAASVIGFVASLIAIPWILVRLPADYFDMRVPRYWMQGRHPILRTVGRFVKNVVGLCFLPPGIAMLLLPGPGQVSTPNGPLSVFQVACFWLNGGGALVLPANSAFYPGLPTLLPR